MGKAIFVLLVAALFLAGCVNMPICGDDICEAGEDGGNCPYDCKLEASILTMEIGGIVNEATINPDNDLISSSFFFGPADSVSLKAIAEASDLKPNQLCFSPGDFKNSEFRLDIENVVENKSGENRNVFVTAVCENNYALLKGLMSEKKNSGNSNFDYARLEKCKCNNEEPCCAIVFEKVGWEDPEPEIVDPDDYEDEDEEQAIVDGPPIIEYFRITPMETTLQEIKLGTKLRLEYKVTDDVGLNNVLFYLEQPSGGSIQQAVQIYGKEFESFYEVRPDSSGKYKVRMETGDTSHQFAEAEAFYVVNDSDISIDCGPVPTNHCADSCTRENDADCCFRTGDVCFVKVWDKSRCILSGKTNPENELEICDPEQNDLGWTVISAPITDTGSIYKPDLVIDNIAFNPQYPLVGQDYSINISLSNTGFVASPDVTQIRMFLKETQESQIHILPSIGANESYLFTYPIYSSISWPFRSTTQNVGTYTYLMELDPNNLIDEVDETNNIKTKDVEINDIYSILSCIDSDMGGTRTDVVNTCINSTGKIYEDYCLPTGSLVEYKCDNIDCVPYYVTCYGKMCYKGTCQNEEDIDWPDMVVENVEITPQNPSPNEVIVIRAGIRNVGAGPAEGSSIECYYDFDGYTNDRSHTIHLPIEVNETKTCTGSALFYEDGNYLVNVIVDHSNKIKESDETNNLFTFTIPVGS
ncbi:MAG: CARDB domain-containing protein [Candidatus Diapherotrites archaeon]